MMVGWRKVLLLCIEIIGEVGLQRGVVPLAGALIGRGKSAHSLLTAF